jgi:CheY-specific phosphatase CheX
VQRVPVDEEQDATELAAVVGFSGENVRGTVGLTAPLTALSATHPSALAGERIDARMLEDWLGELANQMMGRIKAQLRRRSVTVWMSTPIVLRGVSIVVTAYQDHVRRYAFSMQQASGFTLWLDVDADAGLELASSDLGPGPAPGEVVLL